GGAESGLAGAAWLHGAAGLAGGTGRLLPRSSGMYTAARVAAASAYPHRPAECERLYPPDKPATGPAQAGTAGREQLSEPARTAVGPARQFVAGPRRQRDHPAAVLVGLGTAALARRAGGCPNRLPAGDDHHRRDPCGAQRRTAPCPSGAVWFRALH